MGLITWPRCPVPNWNRLSSTRRAKAAGAGNAPQVVLRRLTNQQYNNTVRDLLAEPTDPANQFSA